MRVLVCGGRDFNDWDSLCYHLLLYASSAECIIHGGAKGADTLAGEWADYVHCSVEVYPAEWDKYGRRAGYIRNKQMLDEGKPDLVIAFPGGKGTAMMIKLAKEANVEVFEVQ